MKLEKILKAKNLRITKQRKLILDFIDKQDKPVSSQDIYDNIKDMMKLDLSTVYRNLNTLEENSILLKTNDIDGVGYYQINKDDHKHFISCSSCGKKFIIENCPIHDLEKEISKSTGFKIEGHNFEFYGICPDCQEKTDV